MAMNDTREKQRRQLGSKNLATMKQTRIIESHLSFPGMRPDINKNVLGKVIKIAKIGYMKIE